MIIDILKYTYKECKLLIGREYGQSVRKEIEKQQKSFTELENDNITILFDDQIMLVNKTCFLGLFQESIQRLGKDKFQEKYKFIANDYIKGKIPEYIEDGSKTMTMTDILS